MSSVTPLQSNPASSSSSSSSSTTTQRYCINVCGGCKARILRTDDGGRNLCWSPHDFRHKTCACSLHEDELDDANKVHHLMKRRCCILGVAQVICKKEEGQKEGWPTPVLQKTLKTKTCSTCPVAGRPRGQCTNQCCPLGDGRGDTRSKPQECAMTLVALASQFGHCLNEAQFEYFTYLAKGAVIVVSSSDQDDSESK